MDRILVNCCLHPSGLRYLADQGYEARVVPEEDPEASLREVPACVGLVANAVLPIDDAFLDRAPRLEVVGRLGVGYDNVDVEAMTRRGVRVVNTPRPVVEPVAEHVFAFLLALGRRVVEGDRSVRAGTFRDGAEPPGPELAGKTLGIVGLGNTGRRVAEIARRGFGMTVVYHDLRPRPEAEAELGVRRLPLDDLLGASDYVTLHVVLDASTRHLIDRRALARLKPGAVLVNLSRGPVVDEDALAAALASGHLGGAGLDVFDAEPPPAGAPILGSPRTVLTPHRGGYSAESIVGVSRVVEDIVRVLRGEEPEFPVN